MGQGDASRSATAASGGKGPGRAPGETPYDPFVDARLNPYPDTMNCIMPFTYYTTAALNPFVNPTPADECTSVTWRLNSITDIITGGSYVEDPTPAADTIDGTPNRPMMFDFWKQIYTYWSVVGSKYRVTVYDTDRTNPSESTCWLYHHGQKAPPYFNQGTVATGKVPDYIRRIHPHCHMKVLHNSLAASGSHLYTSGVTFKGYYAPGPDYVHNEVVEDEFNKRWHKESETAPLHEKASLYIQRSDLQDTIDKKQMNQSSSSSDISQQIKTANIWNIDINNKQIIPIINCIKRFFAISKTIYSKFFLGKIIHNRFI